MVRGIVILLYCCIVILTSCKFFQKKKSEPDEKPVARVLEKKLYLSDLTGLVKPGTPAKDSSEIINNYIDSWIRKSLVLYVAEKNLSEEQKNIEKQLNDYRESLLIFLYEKAIVNQKLDTSVNDSDIKNYYEKYQSNFKLKDNLVLLQYVVAKKETHGIDSVKIWMKAKENEKFKAKLNDFCQQYTVNYTLDNEQWFTMEEVMKFIPIKTNNQENYLKYLWKDKDGNRFVEFKDSVNAYVLNITDYKLKGEIAPLSYIENDIEKIILNKRKLTLTKKIYDDIYKDALKKGDFEIYK